MQQCSAACLPLGRSRWPACGLAGAERDHAATRKRSAWCIADNLRRCRVPHPPARHPSSHPLTLPPRRDAPQEFLGYYCTTVERETRHTRLSPYSQLYASFILATAHERPFYEGGRGLGGGPAPGRRAACAMRERLLRCGAPAGAPGAGCCARPRGSTRAISASVSPKRRPAASPAALPTPAVLRRPPCPRRLACAARPARRRPCCGAALLPALLGDGQGPAGQRQAVLVCSVCPPTSPPRACGPPRRAAAQRCACMPARKGQLQSKRPAW